MDPISPETQAELARRHKATATTVLGLLVGVILLAIVAFVSRPYLELKPPNLYLDWVTRLLVLFFGLGAVVWRRNRFSAMRLQDIAGVAGTSALIKTLEKTTLQLALCAAVIAVIGFAVTLIQGNELYTYWSCAIAVVVLIYCYPTKSSWLKIVRYFTDPQTEPATE